MSPLASPMGSADASPLSRSSSGSNRFPRLGSYGASLQRVHDGFEPDSVRATFRLRLLQTFGNLMSAWRKIDPNGHGRISYCDFCRAGRGVGYLCNIRTVFEALDTDEDGFVVLEDIDPGVAVLLKDFLTDLIRGHGSAKAAWQNVFNEKKGDHQRVPWPVFEKACLRCGYGGNIETVYRQLNADRCSTGVSYRDFLMLDKLFTTNPTGLWHHNDIRPANSLSDLRAYKRIPHYGTTLLALQGGLPKRATKQILAWGA